VDPLPKPVSLNFGYQWHYSLTNRQRPQIMVNFRNRDPESGRALGFPTRVNVVVDSGCDVTLLPGRYAGSLGIPDITALNSRDLRGISGSLRCYGKVNLIADLCGRWVDVPVYFSSSDESVGLLGRDGAFDALHIGFVNRHRILYASPAPPT
jgi:hypothetical protein